MTNLQISVRNSSESLFRYLHFCRHNRRTLTEIKGVPSVMRERHMLLSFVGDVFHVQLGN